MASDDLKLLIHTSSGPEAARESTKEAPRPGRRARRLRVKTRLNFQERLLRNCCIACGVLLGALALGNLEAPWAVKASQGIEQALTMRVDLDESLGQPSFVKKLMPESALVFFNLSGESELLPPAQGELTHAYQAGQPWLMFDCAAGDAVCAAADGSIAAVSPLSDGSFGVLIDHGEGLESVTANLSEVSLRAGDAVLRGGIVGTAAGEVYFELREAGQSCDPTERMGL